MNQMLDRKYPKDILLADGSEVLLRPPAEPDGEALLTFFRELPPAEKWFFKEDPCDPEVVRKWIAGQSSGRAFSIAAFRDAGIVAHGSLLLRPYGAHSHIARLRLTVAPAFRHRHLGTWMTFDLVRRAMELGIEKLRADLVVGIEDAAIYGISRLDFIAQCRIKDYFRDQEGHCYDCMVMMKTLHRDWSDF